MNYDKIQTKISETENVINSKPLTYLSDEHFRETLYSYHLICVRNLFAATTFPIKNDLTTDEAKNCTKRIQLFPNDTHREKLCFTQLSTRMAAWLFPTFFIYACTINGVYTFYYHVLKNTEKMWFIK